MKLVAISLFVLLAVGLLYVYASDTPTAPAELSMEIVPESQAAVPEDLPAASPAPALQAASQSERTLVETPVAVEEEPEAPSVMLKGRVILVDDSGAELGKLDGKLSIVCWTSNSGGHAELEITNGTFEVDVEGIDKLSVDNIEFGGRGALAEDSSQYYPVDQGPIVIRAHWPRMLLLSVLSEETRAHLNEVTLVMTTSWLDDDMQHPGRVTKGRQALSDGYSPVELRPSIQDARSGGTTYFVHSPGFAWKPIQLDLSKGGEREIRLDAGGDVEIRTQGPMPKGGALLRLRQSGVGGSRPFAEVPLRGEGPVEITGLLPGIYAATVEVGEWYDDPLVSGRVEIEVKAGERGQYELVLDPPPELVLAPLAGTVVVPAEWNLDTFQLTAEFDGTSPDGRDGERELSMSDMKKLTEKDAWAFQFGELPTGTYLLELDGGGWPELVEYPLQVTLDPAGLLNVRLEVPPPATVVIRLVDPASGEVAGITSIHWGALPTSSDYARSLLTITRDDEAGRFEFLAPIGWISVGAFGNGYDSLREKVEIHVGQNEFRFELERDCPLVILLLDGEAPVPFPEDYYPDPEHLDGEGRLLYTSSSGAGFKTGLNKPGRYVFDIPEVPGFEPIPQQTITVKRGEQTKHVIQLVRNQ